MIDNNYAELRKIRREDIPDEWQEAYDTLGHDVFMTLVREFGGQHLYFPKLERLMLNGRDREICARFDGHNYNALAKMFRLSERRIRIIVEEGRKCRGDGNG